MGVSAVKRSKSPKRGVWLIVLAFFLLALFLGVFFLRKHETAITPPSVPTAPQSTGLVTVSLFFAAQSGNGLMKEGRDIGPCDELSSCLEEILQELINGPQGELAPVLPVTGMFNSVQLDGNTARVDFAQELIDGLPGGSSSELYAVYAIVNSICFNYPQVQQVVFTLNGKPMDTLKGHLDVSRPLTPDFSLLNETEELRPGRQKNDKD